VKGGLAKRLAPGKLKAVWQLDAEQSTTRLDPVVSSLAARFLLELKFTCRICSQSLVATSEALSSDSGDRISAAGPRVPPWQVPGSGHAHTQRSRRSDA
jgi:hypothetical protein